MRLEGVLLLAAPTARSQAYLQSLVRHDLRPERVLAMGDSEAGTGAEPGGHWNGLDLPDLSQPLAETSARADIPIEASSATDVNAPAVIERLRALAPRLVIYSGYGGQIVGEVALSSAPRFLHIHSGWLPDYRGSTTVYYALLAGEDPGVTAIVLDRHIDTGPMVAQRRYPRPPAGLDIDRVYDPAIRADLLVRVMREYASGGDLPPAVAQPRADGETFYVIHPVLKHLAILSLQEACGGRAG